MALMYVFFQLEAVFTPGSARLLTGEAYALYHDFATAGSTLLPIEELCKYQIQRTVVYLAMYGIT
jgi:hypothetical protein